MTICIPTKEGIPYIQWINILFGDCIYGKQEAISLLLGYCSIFFWLNAQLPQVVENYRLKSANGLSLNFLSIWLAADTANLIGALLTEQLPFQLFLGFYFVSIDICVLFRNDEYLVIPQQSNKTSSSPSAYHFTNNHTLVHISDHIPIQYNETTPLSTSTSSSKWYTISSSNNTSKLMSILLFTVNTTVSTEATSLSHDNLIWIGRVSAWLCTTLYLVSRIPQLLKNRRRQSVQGLSMSLFIFAACANFTYSASILTHPGHTIGSLLEASPFLIGSSGTLVFDFFIFCQFLYYRNNSNKNQDEYS
ncbi:PQ loop repeat-domain-containing protein [Sporodiniella umbellata]|nr:PQ loop repeat-domain-containing protein [Sporodiniella umbellata]